MPEKDLAQQIGRAGRKPVGCVAHARAGASHMPVLLLVVFLAVVATVLCYRAFLCKYDSTLRTAVQSHLVELFPDANVFVGRVREDGLGKLIVSDLRIARKTGVPREQQVLSAERVELVGDLDIAHWMQQSIQVQRVDLYGAQIDLWPQSETEWSAACLKPKPNSKSKPPTLAFHDALMRIGKYRDDQDAIVVHGLVGTVENRSGTAAGAFYAHVVGKSSGYAQSIELHAEVDPSGQSVRAAGVVSKLNFSKKLIDALPKVLASSLVEMAGLECISSSKFEMVMSPNVPLSYRIAGRVESGHLIDARLPYALENLSGEYTCVNSQLEIKDVRARSGSAQLSLNAAMELGSLSSLRVKSQIENLSLDDRLYQALPEKLRESWDRLRPTGRVSAVLNLTHNGSTLVPNAVVNLQSVSIEPWLFPYPLTHIEGQVTYSDGVVRTEGLTGQAGGQVAEGVFRLGRAGNDWYGRLVCRTNGALAIDDQLVSALTQAGKPTSGAEKIVRSLNPSGTIELTNATFERSPNEGKWHRRVDANVYGGSLRYTGFSYPLSGVRGRILGEDDLWRLDRFEGGNDSGRIECSGKWEVLDDGDVPFRLDFRALALPVEEELQQALPKDVQFVWDELQPSGAIDEVTATVMRRPGATQIESEVSLIEDSSSNSISGRSLRLNPKSFPYWLTDVDCRIRYRPGLVSIERASATNGLTRMAITGDCRPTADGRWLADIQWLPTTRLIVDRAFLRAVPKSVRDSLARLDFSGPVGLLGSSKIVFANQNHPHTETAWNCQLDIEDGKLADGANIGALRGTLDFEGRSDGEKLSASGNLNLDALTVRGIPVTQLRGPFALLDSRLYFGSGVAVVNPAQASVMTADALGGKLTLSGQGLLEEGKFYVDADLENAQLTSLLQDVGVAQATSQANCNATLEFSGVPWNPQTYVGRGNVQLRNAKLYQLPFMLSLLRAASVNTSDDSAFQTADVNFTIDGDRIPLTSIACDGDVLRLRGEGWINLRREVDLELYSYVGRRMPLREMVAPIMPDSRYATFMMIEVGGTLDNPVMQRKPFPQLEATLQQIFPEVAERQGVRGLVPWN